MIKYGGNLVNILEEKHRTKYFELQKVICNRGVDYSTLYDNESFFTSHSYLHLRAVEEYIYEMIGKTNANKLSEKELYILLCSIYMHDYGMARSGERKNHHLKSEEYVINNSHLFIDENYATLVGKVIRSHGEDDLVSLVAKTKTGMKTMPGLTDIRIGTLMALLRMGDLMDMTKSRAPLEIANKRGANGSSLLHWYEHSWITEIRFDHKQRIIFILAKPVGPYSSRVLEKKRQYCIEQLSINRAYLEEIDVRYDTIEWDNATQKKLYLYSKKTDSRKYIEPFAIFDKSSYTHLYGREREEDDLIKTILNSKVKNKAAVLVGPSKIGKSSLVHGRIEQAFTEMDFSVRIYDYISDDKFFSENNISEGNSEKTPSNKRLIIFDQAERLLTGNNSDSITKRLKSLHHDTISDSGLYILFVIRNDYYSEFKAFLSSIDLTEELCFLNHALGIDILKKLLIENSIVYSDDVLRNIDNYLSLIDKNDLTTLQIVISSLIKKNCALLDSEEIIYKTFGSIDKMVDAVMHGFFNNIFEGLNKSERYLLMSACNNRQNGTIRAFTPAHTEEKESLKSRNIITVLDDDSYEFIHDALAEYFCKEVLNGCEKELLKLKSIISEGNVSPDALQKIQKYRTHLIQLYHFSEKAIGQLIYYYATENNTDQIDYWFSHYLSCDTLMAVIDSFTNGFFDRLTSTSFPYYRDLYVDCVRKCYESLPDIEKNRFTLSLNNKWSTSKKYMEFCAVDILNSIIPYEVRDSVISIHEGATIYNALLIEPQFKDIFCEIYYFLYFHDLLDNIVEKNTINAVWLRRVAIMLQYGMECGFYRIICENENVFDEQKYRYMVSVIINIINDAREYEFFSVFTGSVSCQNNSFIFYCNDGKTIPLKCENKSETVFKFTYNKTIDVGLINQKDSLIIVALLKHFTVESLELFQKKDIENTIRKYKIFYNENHSNQTFLNAVNLYFNNPRNWRSIIQIIECEWDYQQCPFGKITGLFPFYVSETSPLYKLLVWLCMITYFNIHKQSKYKNVEIYLIKNKIKEQSYNLFDSFYIRLIKPSVKSNMNELFIDPYHIRGVQHNTDTCVSFVFPDKEKNHNGFAETISNEIQYNNNASNAVAVSIGHRNYKLLLKHKSAFSYILFWDDKINQVSKAVDMWEYELNKLFSVLQANSFVTDIFVIGNVYYSRKAVGYLLSLCKHFEDYSHLDELKINANELRISTPFLLSSGKKLLKKLNLHIIYGSEYENLLNKQINSYYNYSQNAVINNCIHIQSCTSTYDLSVINEYSRKNGITSKTQSIIADSLDEAYRLSLCMLYSYGEKQVDAYNKGTTEMKSVTITIPDIYKSCYKMSYRRNEIETYYKSQWIDEDGDVYKRIHANHALNINQLDTIIGEIVNNVNQHNSNRKLMFSFYIPTSASIKQFEMPSLLQCFVFVRYERDDVLLDSVFVWRTNECLLGLPMSLESSIRWLDEIVLTDINKRSKQMVKLGTYRYCAINLHGFDNNIARGMVAKLLSESNNKTKREDL